VESARAGRVEGRRAPNGKAVAADVLRAAGRPHVVRLTADRKSLAADGRSLAFVTAETVDARGVVVPDAGHRLPFDVRGGSLAGPDNGHDESAECYQASTRTAFGAKALAIVRSGARPGAVKGGGPGGGPADREGERPGHVGAR
jgi:beta-galactosidase